MRMAFKITFCEGESAPSSQQVLGLEFHTRSGPGQLYLPFARLNLFTCCPRRSEPSLIRQAEFEATAPLRCSNKTSSLKLAARHELRAINAFEMSDFHHSPSVAGAA